MQNHSTVETVRTTIAAAKSKGLRIGFVPTMGNLHEGHLALVQHARKKADFIVCSIFVNPLQFGPNEDLDSYPKTLEDDITKLQNNQCDLAFLPSASELIRTDGSQQASVHVPTLGENFCGNSRPGHFDGVSTIVCKLFNIVQPDIAFFGLKDYQQFLIVQQMTKDLALPIAIEGVETVRESSGLAMSSRNHYLSLEQKQTASLLYTCLLATKQQLLDGNRDFHQLEETALSQLSSNGFKPDYFAIRNADNLTEPTSSTKGLIVLVAAYLDGTRLIDNVRLEMAD